MEDTITLTKVLSVREKEKNDAQLAHHESLLTFEEAATALYTILKKKEVAEESYEEYIQNTIPINKIREQTTYIEQLNKQIAALQGRVIKARNQMHFKQTELTNAHVEVRKFEKIIEHRKVKRAEMVLKHEQQMMDEISIQQFISQNR